MTDEPLVDLQTHSIHSDGTCTPAEIVERAAGIDLSAVALTDHDTVAGVPAFLEAGQRHGIETIPAVELSVQTTWQGVDLLGYLIDPDHPALTDLLQHTRALRRQRLPRMLDALAEAGAPVDQEAVEAFAGGEVVGRPHVARALVEAGHADSVDEAFDQLIGHGCPGYVPKERIPAGQAIEAVHAAGGAVVLAHPCFIHPAHFDELLRALVDQGLDGLEVFYTDHDRFHLQHFGRRAREYGLVMTGGSDFHGENKPDIQLGRGYGDLAVPYSAVEGLRARAARYQ